MVALTNYLGNTVQVYDYSVYGQVGAQDASHPNRLMFTGREFDKETGLYYYRARHYKPEIGRFLQVDPVGYRAGMNLYVYCHNDPPSLNDPYGRDYTDGYPKRDPMNARTQEWVWTQDECLQWHEADSQDYVEELGSVSTKLLVKSAVNVAACLVICSPIPIAAIFYIKASMFVPGQGFVIGAVGFLLYAACIGACEAMLPNTEWVELHNRSEELKAKTGELRMCYTYCSCRASGENHEACKKDYPENGCPSFFRGHRDKKAAEEALGGKK